MLVSVNSSEAQGWPCLGSPSSMPACHVCGSGYRNGVGVDLQAEAWYEGSCSLCFKRNTELTVWVVETLQMQASLGDAGKREGSGSLDQGSGGLDALVLSQPWLGSEVR